jgi:aminoglycoside phosphotransferase (APT) family kinase protein
MDADAETRAILESLGLIELGERVAAVPLAGGVSSEIWRVVTPQRTLCIKRALARLKVSAVWEAPVERNHYEAEWLRVAGAIAPAAVPKLLWEAPEAGALVMDYLDPAQFAPWKERLRAGDASAEFAAAVGATIAGIHAATADDPAIAQRFPTDAVFHAIRLEPYLEATGRVHRDLEPRLMQLCASTASTKRCLVHGDVSPKNILVGPHGPVFLDAECAWFGDPAFDLGFVLNHLMLKCLWTPSATAGFLAAFRALADAYLEGIRWESRERLEARVAALLPGLLLARVDGKSPVEYVQAEADKDRVRRTARHFLLDPSERLAPIADFWARELAG